MKILQNICKCGPYLAFPLYVAMVVVGSIYKKECPVSMQVPCYLFLGKGKESKILSGL